MEARQRPHTTKTDSKEQIIKTLLDNRKRRLAENTLLSISYSLKQISKNADLNNPEDVKLYIANLNVSNCTKLKHAKNYNYYCISNGIRWERPNYKWERKIPIIPTTANVDKIISASRVLSLYQQNQHLYQIVAIQPQQS